MPKVSVVIPAYNCDDHIEDAINSVFKQTYDDFEIIVVDDGSTDNTNRILLNYITKYPNKLKYFYQDNKGVSAARNRGIAEARGDFIAFLDADDRWDIEKLKEQVAYFSKNQSAGLVYTDYREESESGFIRKKVKLSKSQCHSFNEILKGKDIATPTIMIRKEVFFNIGAYNIALLTGEDFELYLRIAKNFPIGFLNKKLATIRRRQTSLSQMQNINSGIINAINSFCSLYPELKNNRCIKKSLSYHYMRKGYELFYWNMRNESIEFFVNSIRNNPFNAKAYLYLFFALCPLCVVSATRKIKKVLMLNNKRLI